MKLDEYKTLLDNLMEAAYLVDQNRKILYWNTVAETITGYSLQEVQNNYCHNNILNHVNENGKQLCLNGCPLHNTLKSGITNKAHVFLQHKTGHRVPVDIVSLPVYEDGKIVAAIELFSDENSYEKLLVENRQMKNLLSYDELTRVSTRRHMQFYIENSIIEFKEFDTTFGILYFDIDFFKNVNDSYGHSIGDDILRLVARNLRSNLRPKDMIGRWGGEEFIAIIKDVTIDELHKIAEKLRILVEKSKLVLDSLATINVTISIGGTIFDSNDTLESIIDRADKLMYQSKVNGRNQTTVK